ncbi:hypothetical protein RSOL_227380, partial [Rhizoctonia solani AG-3 Rhs1AP]
MEGSLNLEELLKDPKFHEFVSQYQKLLVAEPKPLDPPEAPSPKPTAKPHIDREDASNRGQSHARDTHTPSTYTHHRTLSGSPDVDFEIPPDGWEGRGYYYLAQTSYETGGKEGSRETKNRGGRVKVEDKKTGEKVKYTTVLEKMLREDKYYFTKEHGHPFAAVVGLPYFNPYGKVLLDDKLTAIIPKTAGLLSVSSSQRLDYSEYTEGRGVMRAAVIANIPNEATIDEGKFLTWAHFGPSARLKVYKYVYALKPYFYHFRDKSGENNWLLDTQAAAYLADSARYYKKSGSVLTPIEYLRRNESKGSTNRSGQKLYIEEPNSENPYYYPILGIDRKYSGKTPSTSVASAAKYMALPPSSSTKARDARRADRVVAEEEARAKITASAAKPGKALLKIGSAAKGKPKVVTKRRVESDDDSDNEGSKLVSRKAKPNTAFLATTPALPTKPKSQSNPNSTKTSVKAHVPPPDPKEPKSEDEYEEDEDEVMEDEMPRGKPENISLKTMATSTKSKAKAPVLEAVLKKGPVKEIAKRNTSSGEKEPKDKPEKVVLSSRERARRKMLPPPKPSPELSRDETETNGDEPQQDEGDEAIGVEVDDEVAANFRSKPTRSVPSPESEMPKDLSKVAAEPTQGRKRAASQAEEEDEDKGESLPIASYQPSGDGMRVVKATKMTVKIPNPGGVTTRTRQKTK